MLHPIEFKERWGLTYVELAAVLKYNSDFTAKSWGLHGKAHREPPGVVHLACGLLNEKWTREGKPQNFLT